MVWFVYYKLVFKLSEYDKSFINKRLSNLKTWRIVFLKFLILNKNQDFFYIKRKDNIYNQTQKIYS